MYPWKHGSFLGSGQGDVCLEQSGMHPEAQLDQSAKSAPLPHFCVYYGNIHKMINWTQIVGFNWDEGNARKSTEKHDVSQAESEQIFFNQPLLLLHDFKHSQNEERFHALGKTDDRRQLHITFTQRTGDKGMLIRVISARDMHRKERNEYEQIKENS